MKINIFLVTSLIVFFSLILFIFPNNFTQIITGYAVSESSPQKIIDIHYNWTYRGKPLSLSFSMPDEHEFYRERSRKRGYDLFASDPFDQQLMNNLADKLESLRISNGFSDKERPYIVASFVQSLPYAEDNLSNPSDEYPKFPYETFYDNGGDCEDTTILMSALLNALGYHTALIDFPEKHHIAVGIDCVKGPQSTAFEFEGVQYCYLETTEVWPIGKMPKDLINVSFHVVPVQPRPFLDLNFVAENYKQDGRVMISPNITVANMGSATADSINITVFIQGENNLSYFVNQSNNFILNPEERVTYSIEGIITPLPNDSKTWRLYVSAQGKDTNIVRKVSSKFVSGTIDKIVS